MACLADDEVPVLPIWKRLGSDHATTLLKSMANAALDPMHGAEPRKLSDQALTHRGHAELPFPRGIPIPYTVSFQVGKHVGPGERPQQFWDVFVVAPVPTMQGKETAQPGRTVNEPRGMVGARLDNSFDPKLLAHQPSAIVNHVDFM